MNILIVAATSLEIRATVEFLQNHHIEDKEFSFLITGVGPIATTYHLTKSLQANKPDYIIQAGIAGSFRSELFPGAVVYVNEELMGDLGAEEDDVFNDIFDLGLLAENQFPFSRKILKNTYIDHENNHGLSPVRSISINEITTRKKRIECILQKYSPDIESMEGAAFHYVCLQEKTPFLQIRAISNYVGERNKEKWELQLAVENLNRTIIQIAHTISK